MMKTKITFKPFFLLLLFVATMGWGQTFEQITSLESLTSGEYLIVGDGSTNDGIMLNTTSSGPIINFTAVTNPGSTITTGFTNNNVFAITVESNQITIYNPSVGYVSWGNTGTGTTNHAGFFNSTPTNNEKWTFSVASGLWTLSNVATPARQLQWNNSSPRFACYTSAQVKLKLYKKQVVVSEPTLSVTPTTISDLTYVVDEGPSNASSFVVSGANLDGSEDVTLLADTGFEISTDNLTFSDEVVLTGYNGANTTIYVRLVSGLTANSYAGIVYIAGYELESEVTVSGTVTEPAEPLNHLVISQVYGGGGNSGAPYKNDFVEIYNPTTSPVNLSGWSIQYASATGTSWTNSVDLPNKSVQPGGYFLVQLAGGATGSDLPTADHTGTINMAGTNGKVALVNSTTLLTGGCPTDASIIDFVGFGSANCFEGSGATSVLSNTTAAIRNNNGCDDTDVNSADFTVATPTPRNSATASFFCDFITSPILTATPMAVSGLNYIVGSGPSNSSSFQISGLNLDGSQDVTVLPGDNFELSLDNSTWFGFAEGGITLTNYTGGATTVSVRLVDGLAVGPYADIVYVEGYGFDLEINVSGEVEALPDPELTASVNSLPDFGDVTIGNESTSQSFTVSGSFLTANVLVVAPGDFVLSTDDTNFSSFLNIGQTGGTLNGQPVTVYVRFQPSFAGSTGGDIEISSTGATTQIVAVSGTGVNPIIDAPIATAATSVGADSFVANWEEVVGAASYQIDVYSETSSLSPELVTNGGYENGNTNGYASASGSDNYLISTANPHTGIYYVSRTGTATSIIQQDVSVEVGKTYVFSFWYNDYAASGTNGLKNFSIQGTSGTSYIEGGTPAKLPAASTWTKYERTFTATQSTVRISLRSYEAVSIDDISIRSTDTVLENVPVLGSPFTVSAPDTSLSVSGLASSTTYYYVVRAFDGTTSENSNEISVLTLTPTLWYVDIDEDGFGDDNETLLEVDQPLGYVSIGGDCNDENNTVYPGATEICYDGLDNDCNGTIDDGCTPIVTVVQPSQCGITLAAVNSYVYANIVSGAQGYRFRVTNLSTNQVQSIDQLLRAFRITQLTNYAFNTTYSVEVSVRINNVWQPFYGTPCNVSTPDTTTQIQASQCNTTLSSVTNTIFADIVPFATGYRFRVTNTLNPVDVQTIDRPIRDFKMTSLSSFQYNTMYNVEVAVRNTDGTYLSYGPVCNITTPLFPTVGLQDSQCDEYQVSSNTETLFAESYPGAQQYRFLLENVGQPYSQTFDRPIRTVTLNNFTGLLPGTTYTVRVAIQLNGVWGPYGKSCSIITPGAGRPDEISKVDEISVNEFKAIAYPNPFATSFAIDVRTSNTEKVSLTVYDMTGRLLESNEVNAADATNYQFGDRYPSGVYNVIVSQGEETRTVRVVKQ